MGSSLKLLREVSIQGNRGKKTVKHIHRGKVKAHGSKPLTRKEMAHIKRGRFIPGLFKNVTVRRLKHV